MSKQIVAIFHPQAWQDDYAVAVDPEGEIAFDVTSEVISLGRTAALKLQDDQYDTDDLRNAAAAPQWIKDWSGPFYIEVQQSISDYFDNKETEL